MFLRLLRWEAERVLGATIVSTGWERGEHVGRPLVVLARHAGAGDSFLIVDMLITDLAREPRIVLKETLRWDPAFDIALGRLPARFIPSRPGSGEDVQQSIADLAVGLDGDDALLIFPEGGNFSQQRRQRAIDRLRDRGLIEEAEQAATLTWMLAPRPGGALAALREATDADVVVVGHAGMDQLDSPAELYRNLPVDHEIRVHWWYHPADTVPREPDAFAAWLLDQWAVVDAWVAANQPVA
jgi:1-acyl-sn-glycerol-3-phosphate acyltransferase